MPDPRTIPTFTTQLWSEEVGIAEATDRITADIGYRFSSGREFVIPPYDARVTPQLDATVQSSSAGSCVAVAAVA